MPKSYFSVDNCTPLSAIPAGGEVHFIGVSGVAMGQLAVALSELGYKVTGSDKEFYEPMGSFLAGSDLTLHKGYDSKNVSTPDLVVIGNAISYGHPEVDEVEQRDLPYTCFPALLGEVLIKGNTSIVACGTHGKSTTTALCAHLLRETNLAPSFFVGGVVPGFERSLVKGSGSVCVVEGDEYDSAFFAKVPKFSFYSPDIAIVNAIEFDHADIYDSIDTIENEFTTLVTSLKANRHALCCIDFERVEALVPAWRNESAAQILTFGCNDSADIKILERKALQGGGQSFRLQSPLHEELSLSIPLSGAYNARNAVAAFSAAVLAGANATDLSKGFATFEGVKRRQEIRYHSDSALVVEDFAHHPTAVALAIEGIKEAYPGWKLWAVFEPRSNTSRKRIFQQQYVDAFSQASEVVLAEVTARSNDQQGDLLNVSELAEAITENGTNSITCPSTEAILSHLVRSAGDKDLFLIMSNGSFGGLATQLPLALAAEEPAAANE